MLVDYVSRRNAVEARRDATDKGIRSPGVFPAKAVSAIVRRPRRSSVDSIAEDDFFIKSCGHCKPCLEITSILGRPRSVGEPDLKKNASGRERIGDRALFRVAK